MSAQAMGWALDQDLPARTKLVLVAIANHADHTDGFCWLKASTIAAEASCTPRSVFRHVGALIRNGYIRRSSKRGADGKQRANDYWILFKREETPWDWGGVAADGDEDDSAAETDAQTHDSEISDPLDVVADNAGEKPALSHGDGDSSGTRQDENAHELSHGPCDIGVRHKDSAEPSKTNPLKAALPTGAPRSYRPPPPPPPQPVGATVAGNRDLIFVFWPSKAYDAWQRVKQREQRRSWNLRTSKDGRLGWYFPSLFPPDEKPPHAVADGMLMTEKEASEFAKTG